MSKVLRACVVVVAASLAVPLWGVPTALADDSVLIPSASGYFNSDGIRKPDEVAAAPPNVTAAADGVAPGNLAVAARGGQENKVSFLLFDLFELDPAATITKAVLTVPLQPNGDGNASVAPAPEKVVACPSGEGGFLGDDGTSLQDAPERKCDAGAVVAVPTKDGSAYAFDVTTMASSWLEMNDGVALTSEPKSRGTAFQVVFKPAEEAKLAVTFTAPEGGLGSFELPVLPADTTTSSAGTGSTDLGTSFETGALPAPDTGLGAVSEPVLSAEVPVTAAEEPAAVEPEVAAAPGATVPVASSGPAPLTPSPAFWLGLLAVGALLALLSLILGDTRVAQAATSQSRLSQALQARERKGARGLGGARPALSL